MIDHHHIDAMLTGDYPHMAFLANHDMGKLGDILPEVEDTFDFDQKNPWHEYDLGTHLLLTLGNMAKLTTDLDLRMAALMHDIGKPASQWFDDNGVAHYYRKRLPDGSFIGQNHAKIGAEMANVRMKALGYFPSRIWRVNRLIYHHMFGTFSSQKGVRKFLERVGNDYNLAYDLLTLRECDFEGKSEENDNTSAIDLMRKLISDRQNS